MDFVETKILREHWDADRRLADMMLSRSKLLEVRDIAISAASNATDFHAANAAGTFSYQDGTWALRDKFVGDDWVVCRTESVESIKNEKLKIIVVFCNVGIACNDNLKPKPRSRKGAGAERLCSGNDLFGGLAEYAPIPKGEYAIYYLMVDEDGACELTRPVLKDNTFSAYVERIFLSDGTDLQSDDLSFDDNDDDVVDDFDPLVVRK